MINNLLNGGDVKKYAKHFLYLNSHTPKNNQLRSKKLAQSHIFNNHTHKDHHTNSYTQRTLLTKNQSVKDRNRKNQSLINTLSPRIEKKNNRISKTSGPQTPTKSLESIYITFKVAYKNQFHIVNLDKCENGLILSNRLNNDLNLGLNKDHVELFALDLTKEINRIIEFIASNESKSNISNSNINGFVIDLNGLLHKSLKIKITIRFNLMSFNYYITNTQEEINSIIDDIIKHINHNKYDKETLQRDLRLSIIESIKKI